MSIITKPMLADPADPKYPIQFPVLASPKLDGIRCLRVDGKTLSRSFKPIPNEHVQEVMSALTIDGLDGELIIEGKTFNEIQSIIMSEEKVSDFTFYVFDYVSSSLKTPYGERMSELKKLKLPSFCKKVLPKLINNQDELVSYEAEQLSIGYEGIMVRSTKGPYKCGRATSKQGYLLKVKQFTDSEARVVGFEELMQNTNEATLDAFGRTERSSAKEGLVPANTLGTLLVEELGDFPWKGKEFGIGTGYDAKTRKEIWDNRKKYLGKIVTYKFQLHGTKDLPRIPVFKGFRSPDDMSE